MRPTLVEQSQRRAATLTSLAKRGVPRARPGTNEILSVARAVSFTIPPRDASSQTPYLTYALLREAREGLYKLNDLRKGDGAENGA